jgi:predicted ATPase
MFPVSSLALPTLVALPARETLARSPAVVLFLLRAQAVKPDFQLTAANASAIAKICVRLDGLPLALELAAARSKLLSPQELLARLSHRLEVLKGATMLNLPVFPMIGLSEVINYARCYYKVSQRIGERQTASL